MIQVKLRENLRYFDDFDTDFSIKAGEVKEFPIRLLKSYTFKRALMNGDLILVSGSVEFIYKDSIFKVDSDKPFDGLFLFTNKETVTKDLKNNVIPQTEAPQTEDKHSQSKGSTSPAKTPEKGVKQNGKTK